jgi:hypothetical protein
MHPSRGSYTELWNNLWGASEQRDVYLCKYDPPPGGSKNSALTYESYDFSSLRSTVLPGHATNFTVRQEYRTLYQTLNDWYTLRPGNQLIRGVVVTGHPGIGVLYSEREPESLIKHCFLQENRSPCGTSWFKDCICANPPLSSSTGNCSFFTTAG